MRIVCISDTHNLKPVVPDGDVLIHAGDLTMTGGIAELVKAADWLASLPHKHKVIIAGNHDFCLQERIEARFLLSERGLTYLCERGETVAGLSIYGSPWTPAFGDWAFMAKRGAPMMEKWERIPHGLDVLVTHGPPYGILDSTIRGEKVGCEDLLSQVRLKRPRLHVFGHIHEARGRVYQRDIRGPLEAGILYVNASSGYRAEHPAEVVEMCP